MKLIYINKIGSNWKGVKIYEFLFSETKAINNVQGESWDSYPALGAPEPPESNFVHKVGKLETDIKLDLIQYSDSFSVFDAVDGVIALGWENLLEYDEYPENRLYFKFGEDLNSVEDKLYERDLVLNYNESVKRKKNED